jgi:hypothetical protein
MKAYIEAVQCFGQNVAQQYLVLEAVAKLHLVEPTQIVTLIRDTPLHTLPSTLLHTLISRRHDYRPTWWGQLLPKSFE